MGYRIDYAPVRPPRRRVRVIRIVFFTLACFSLFLLITSLVWPRGTAFLREMLLPGDAAVTAAALEDLAADLKAGDPLETALRAFCQAVLRGADLGPY